MSQLQINRPINKNYIFVLVTDLHKSFLQVHIEGEYQRLQKNTKMRQSNNLLFCLNYSRKAKGQAALTAEVVYL